jgi:hypothetical protein
MSVAPVKSGNYILPLLPPLFLTAGIGLAAIRAGIARRLPQTQFGWPAIAAAGAIAAAAQIRVSSGGPRLESPVPAAIEAVWLLILVAAALPRAPAIMKRAGLALAIVLAISAGLARDWQLARARPHVTGFARLAARLEPALRNVDPRQPCFISPEWPSLSFYTFRRGRYWESSHLPAAPDSALSCLRGARPFFFVVGTGRNRLYGGLPDSSTSATLAREGHRLPGLPGDELVVVCNEALWRALGDGASKHEDRY